MTLYKNTKEMVRSPDGDNEFFGIVSGIFQRDTLMFLICLDYVLWKSIGVINENSSAFKKKKR